MQKPAFIQAAPGLSVLARAVLLTAAIAIAVLGALLAAGPAEAQQIIRVPEDVADLSQAFGQVPDGGIIELAPGTYPSPEPVGFRIRNPDKGFTVRSAAGGRAVLTGEGARPVLTLENGNRGRTGLITFEGITFRDGFAAPGQAVAAGVTVRQGEATFRDCLFEANDTRSGITGGGLSVAGGSTVVVLGSTFRRNTDDFLGGGLALVDSELVVRGSRFEGNSVAVPGHAENSSGGGLFVLSSTATVTDTVFESNRAALAGGGLFVFGNYTDEPGFDSVVRVERTTFRGNEAFADACCPTDAPSSGGALHTEDNVRVTVTDSYLVGNRARFGGAVSVFRSEMVVEGSVFEENGAREPGDPLGLGGAIVALSSAGEAQGRPSAALTVRRSLLQGETTGPGASQGSAQLGGCVAISGDQSDLAAGNGGLAFNRSPVVLEAVAFHRCNAFAPDGTPSFGGALSVELVDLAGERLLFLDSKANGTPSVGGGLSARAESKVSLTGATFAGNEATSFGGGLFAAEAPELEVEGSRFFENVMGNGAGEPAGSSRGAAIYTESSGTSRGGGRSLDARGTVQGSLFVANQGIEIRDREIAPGENAIRYLDNQFFTTTFGTTVYAHNPVAPLGVDASGLNALTVPGTGDKGSGNTRVTSRPRAGDLLVFPAAGADADPSPAYGAYAGSSGPAVLEAPGGDRNLPGSRGVVEIDGTPGDYQLRVGGTRVATDRIEASEEIPPLPPGPFLFAADLPDFRFKVEIAAAGDVLTGNQERDCISETVCVSGALPGRSEAFLRVVGPRPNGFLQPILVKFSTSEVRIWTEQVSTGTLRYYELPAVDGSAGRLLELDGLVDRTGFLPTGAARSPARGRKLPRQVERLSPLEALEVLGARVTTEDPPPPIPPGSLLTTNAFPDFRFAVRIVTGGTSRLGVQESDCLPETLCVSGAIPGRSEVFLRVVGPKPNGFLQPTIVRFSASTLEVWIERPSTGEVRFYRLEGVSAGTGNLSPLDGAIDREGFLP